MKIEPKPLLMAAPLQGITVREWRNAHRKVYGEAVDWYFTPFVRLEGGEPRGRDLRDAAVEPRTIPQIIFKDASELGRLTEALVKIGHRRIDLNMGCPFPLQVNRGRGGGILASPESIRAISDEMNRWGGEVKWSAKMRVGIKDSDGWEGLIDAVDSLPLEWLTVHPRTVKQQYGGEADRELFGKIVNRSRHQLIYNGDIFTAEDFDEVIGQYPCLKGVMVGRGLCGRPSLAAEIAEGMEWPREVRIRKLLEFHAVVKESIGRRLCGDVQIIRVLRSFWEYAEGEIGHKAWKSLRKAKSQNAYQKAFSLII